MDWDGTPHFSMSRFVDDFHLRKFFQLKSRVRFNFNSQLIIHFKLAQLSAFDVQQMGCQFDWQFHEDFTDLLFKGQILNFSENQVGHGQFRRIAGNASCNPLTTQFQQSELRDFSEGTAGFIGFQGISQFLFNSSSVFYQIHVDEIDHNQTTEIPKTELACGFFSRFKVGSQSSFFNVFALGGTSGIDVDGNQCLGRNNHQTPSGRKRDLIPVKTFHLGFDSVRSKECLLPKI